MKVTIIFPSKNTPKMNSESITMEGETIHHILTQCQYTIEEVIILREGQVVLEEEVSSGDTIELLPVASGG
jgi:sulfur carrier protein ThiS